MMDDDAYKALVMEIFHTQQKSLQRMFSGSDDPLAEFGLTAAHVTGFASSSALLTIAIAGSLAAGNREIFVAALNAAVGSFMTSLRTAPEIWEQSNGQGARLN